MPLGPRAQSAASSARQSSELAIAIPTYNRAAQLASLLAQLTVQLTEETLDVRDRVVIVVSNNHSADSTAAVLDEFAVEHPAIAFEAYEQEQNIGPIPNIHFLVGVARAEWTWCLGDDDLLFDGALRVVLETLPSIESDLLLVRTRDIAEWTRVPSGRGLRHVRVRSDEGARCLMAAGFLGSVLIRTAAWRVLLERASAFGAPHFANWVAALLTASSGETIALLDEETTRGNANMVGPVRFEPYAVLVLERLKVWRGLNDAGGAEREIANAIRPQLTEVFRRTWRSIAATSDRSLPRPFERLRGFAAGVRLLGWPAVPAIPWLVIAMAVPERLRAFLARRLKRATSTP